MLEVRPAGITVWWIGEAQMNAAMLEQVRTRVAGEFGLPVSLDDPGERPRDTFDARRGQHASREVLRWVAGRSAPMPGRVLGITDVDLFIPVLTFVFGEAQLEGRAAIVSIARLLDPASPPRTTLRLECEAVHELGHTFGLLHCDGGHRAGGRMQPCVMTRSASVTAVDRKSNRLCPDCRTRFRLLLQDGSHVYREHQDSHR